MDMLSTDALDALHRANCIVASGLLARVRTTLVELTSRRMERLAYEAHVRDDLEWLSVCPASVEADHVKLVVSQSTMLHYTVVDMLGVLAPICTYFIDQCARLDALVTAAGTAERARCAKVCSDKAKRVRELAAEAAAHGHISLVELYNFEAAGREDDAAAILSGG